MAIAAVPRYLGDDYSQASPGLRFGMYLKLWGINNRGGERLWTTHDLNYRVAGKDKQEREFRDENKTSALREALRLSIKDQAAMTALAARQAGIARAMESSGELLRLETQSVAPFATGLGNEHPLENGFAFLNPYGLPYLAGSSVKGVLRQAAHELASGDWGDSKGWNDEARFTLDVKRKTIALSMLDVLFGKQGEDGDTEHVRGVLCFWDVYPQLKGNALQVEVMTPHQTHYYQHGESPHESGSPNPINFLTVPPGSGFAFHVQCDRPFLVRLAPDLAWEDRWKSLIETAFEHAFLWLGFGAKTAVGYGAMERPGAGRTPLGHGPVGNAAAALSVAAETSAHWNGVELKFNPGNHELTATHQGKLATARDPESQRLRNLLPEEFRARLKKNKALKNCEVSVEPIGKAWRLVEIRSVGGISLADE
jgi:CRISPR-associated protein Cmr6